MGVGRAAESRLIGEPAVIQSVQRLILARPIIVLTVVMLAVASFWVSAVLSPDNIVQVLRQVSVPAIMGIGVTFVVICGRLDLSIGSLLSLCVVMVIQLHDRIGPGLAIPIVLGIGIASGCVAGLLVGFLRLNSLIATLGMLSILQGLTYVLAGGVSPRILHPESTWLAFFGRGYLFGVPAPVLILFGLALVFGIVLERTVFGRSVFAVGGGETASVFSTINAPVIIFLAYVISGLLTAVGGIVLASRVMSGQNDTGSGYELLVLSGVILGGTSLLGGAGGVGRSLLGMIVLGFLSNALILLGAPYYSQWIITAMVIIAAVWTEIATARQRVFA
jgi:ribose transport system permease protein